MQRLLWAVVHEAVPSCRFLKEKLNKKHATASLKEFKVAAQLQMQSHKKPMQTQNEPIQSHDKPMQNTVSNANPR